MALSPFFSCGDYTIYTVRGTPPKIVVAIFLSLLLVFIMPFTMVFARDSLVRVYGLGTYDLMADGVGLTVNNAVAADFTLSGLNNYQYAPGAGKHVHHAGRFVTGIRAMPSYRYTLSLHIFFDWANTGVSVGDFEFPAYCINSRVLYSFYYSGTVRLVISFEVSEPVQVGFNTNYHVVTTPQTLAVTHASLMEYSLLVEDASEVAAESRLDDAMGQQQGNFDDAAGQAGSFAGQADNALNDVQAYAVQTASTFNSVWGVLPPWLWTCILFGLVVIVGRKILGR
jgi:hypothetical protein